MSTRFKYSDQQIQDAVTNSISCAEALRFLGIRITGGGQSHLRKRIDRAGISLEHWKGQAHNRGKKLGPRRHADDILVMKTDGVRERVIHLRRALDEIGREVKCEDCGLGDIWNGYPIQLEVDHKDRNWLNNTRENLRYLCPNCHSQYGGIVGVEVVRDSVAQWQEARR